MSTEPESFPRLPIRPGMDVYSAYQDQYLGTVVRVWRRAARRGSGAGAAEKESRVAHATITHEEGSTASHARAPGSKTLGEELGPVPTVAAGNTGPANQSADRYYATAQSAGGADVVLFAVRPGRINLGPLTPAIYIPTDAVCSVSMERVVVDVQSGQIPPAWRRRPDVTSTDG